MSVSDSVRREIERKAKSGEKLTHPTKEKQSIYDSYKSDSSNEVNDNPDAWMPTPGRDVDWDDYANGGSGGWRRRDNNDSSSSGGYQYISEPDKDDYDGWYGEGGYYDRLLNDPYALPETPSGYKLTIPTDGVSRSTDVYVKRYNPQTKMIEYLGQSGDTIWRDYVANPYWRQTSSGFEDPELGDAYSRQTSKYGAITRFVRDPEKFGQNPSWYDGGQSYNAMNNYLDNINPVFWDSDGAMYNSNVNNVSDSARAVYDFTRNQFNDTMKYAQPSNQDNGYSGYKTPDVKQQDSTQDNYKNNIAYQERGLIENEFNLNPNKKATGINTGKAGAVERALAGDIWKDRHRG